MKIFLLSTSILLCQVTSVFSTEILLMELTDSNNKVKLRYVVDADHLLKTPSWVVGEASPLDQKKLLSVIHEKYPELKNEDICGIELDRVIRNSTIDGQSIECGNKWYYTVLWNKDNKLERIIVLMDGSIVEPKQMATIDFSEKSPPIYKNPPIYIGDDPRETRQMKKRIDEQLRLIAPGLAEPAEPAEPAI